MKRLLLLCLASGACARPVAIAPLPALPFATDTVRAQQISDGVVRRFVYSPQGPWAIHVLDVDLARCNAGVAVKGVDSAASRIKTTVLLRDLATRTTVFGGVNADFFSLANGTPAGMLIVDGKMLTPPSAQPVLAFDSAGTPHIGVFTRTAGTLRPFYPRDAVGGRPLLVRNGVMVSNIDSAGGAAFAAARHPRTAAGIMAGGKRLLLVVVDGRQAPYSDGMTLRELATLMLSLGARDAVNLDGGGSTTLVYADAAHGGALELANRPSDKEGERGVGDAVGIVRRCGAR
ncbi:MAG: phosphodiester glycosidase family protein [Gemmatimonadota bacterium]